RVRPRAVDLGDIDPPRLRSRLRPRFVAPTVPPSPVRPAASSGRPRSQVPPVGHGRSPSPARHPLPRAPPGPPHGKREPPLSPLRAREGRVHRGPSGRHIPPVL